MKYLLVLISLISVIAFANPRVININETNYQKVRGSGNEEVNILVSYPKEDIQSPLPLPIVNLSTEKESGCVITKIEVLRIAAGHGYNYPFAIHVNVASPNCLVWVKNPYSMETMGVVVYESQEN